MFIKIFCHFAICLKRNKYIASVAKIQFNIYILQANSAFFVILYIFTIKKGYQYNFPHFSILSSHRRNFEERNV